MSRVNIQYALFIVTAGVIFIESTMLLIGMNIPKATAWSGVKNLGLAISDIVLAGILILLIIQGRIGMSPLLFTTLGLLFLTHIFRDGEYLMAHQSNPFIFNTPLFILNNVRLILVILLGIITAKAT